MKANKFKHQIESDTLRRVRDNDEVFSLEQETKPSRLDNKRLRDYKHEMAKDKKFNRWH